MKLLEAISRPIAGIVMGMLGIAMGTLLWLNLRTQEELKLYQATMTEGAKMYAEPSEKSNALPRYKNNPVQVLGVTKDGWVLAESSDLNIGWVKAENISVNGGKELKPIQTAVVLVNKLNIHSYPRLASTTKINTYGLKYAPKGDRVIVTGAEEDGWVPVYYFIRDQYQKGSSIKGYVPANNIFIEDGSGAAKSAKLIAPQGIKEITVAGYTSIYLFSRKYNDVRFHNKEIPIGDKFIMLENADNGWIKAWYDGVEGWVKVYDLNKLKIEY